METQERRNGRLLMGLVMLLISSGVLVAGVGTEPAEDPNEIRWDLAERFDITWDSVQLSARVFNPTDTRPVHSEGCERNLAVFGEIHVLDSNDLVGMDVAGASVLEVVGHDGNDVKWKPAPSLHVRQYRGLQYIHVLAYVPGTGMAAMEKLEPYDTSVSFDLHPSQAAPFSLSLLQWHINALYAEDVIGVDVPFEASKAWLEVLPGLQIQVEKADLECFWYRYRTVVRHEGGTVQALDARLFPGETVADYLVVKTELIDSEGSPLLSSPGPISSAIWSESVEGNVMGAVTCEGMLTWLVRTKPASIRHVIVVHPREVRVPFELADIPVPTLEPTPE